MTRDRGQGKGSNSQLVEGVEVVEGVETTLGNPKLSKKKQIFEGVTSDNLKS